MNIHRTHHIYNIVLPRKCFWKYFFLRELSSAAPILDNAAWAIHSTYHTVPKASPGTAIFGRDMIFDIPFIANWNKIRDYRQHQTDLSTARENKKRVDYDYKVSDRILVVQDGILQKHKAHMARSHGLYQRFIQMELSGFNTEQNWNK